MAEKNRLVHAFKQTSYRISGHGERNIQVLKDALADVDGEQSSDIYGKGKIIEDFQEKMATYLGKEDAVFFPSGTMAQQIALRIWCDQQDIKKVAYHPLCHLEIHEEDGLKELHHIEPILLADKTRVITLDDVVELDEEIACLLLELPQREIGGQLPEYETLVAISDYCREKGIKLHLDGARLLEILPYYGKTAEEVCALFDSVYVSFYKGVGGVAGAILVGGRDFIKGSKIWKRRHGGDLISLYPYILSADHFFEKRAGKMAQYYEEAKELAALFNECNAVSTTPEHPVSNMFHVHIDMPQNKLEELLAEIYETTGVGLTSYTRPTSDTSCYFEVSIGDSYAEIPKEVLRQSLHLLNKKQSGY